MIKFLEALAVTLRVIWSRNVVRRGVEPPLQLAHIGLMLAHCITGANRLWLSRQYISARGSTQGLRFAERHVRAGERAGIRLLQACAVGDDDAQWVSNVNAYLASFQTPAIDLCPGHVARFSRLRGADTPQVVNNGELISVVMPAFNSEKTIELSARSVLSQSWRNLELIIVDDCSSDGTWKKVQKLAASDPRVRGLKNVVNVGPYVSKNLALRVVRGAYVTGQDADDWAHPSRLEQDFEQLQSAKAQAVVSRMVRLNENGLFFPNSGVAGGALNPTASISLLIKTQFLKSRLGAWDSVRFGADAELIDRAERLLQGKLVRLNTIGLFCLQHTGSLTNHPVHGSLSAARGVSPVRLAYKTQYRRWHSSMGQSGVLLDFPLMERKFEAPEAMHVPLERVFANVDAHDGQLA